MTTSSAVVPSLLDADGGGTAPQIAAKQHGESIQSGINDEDGEDRDGSDTLHQRAVIPSDSGGGGKQLLLQSERDNQKLIYFDQNVCCTDNDSDIYYIGDIHHDGEEEEKQNGHLGSANMSDGQRTATVLESSLSSLMDDPAKSVKVEHHRMTRRRRRHVPAAVIEQDASTAFSQYRPVSPLSFLVETRSGETLGKKSTTGKQGRRRGRTVTRSIKRDRNGRKCADNASGDASEDNIQLGNASATLQQQQQQLLLLLQLNTQTHEGYTTTIKFHPESTMKINDPIHSILLDDPILQDYLSQLKFLSDNYYPRVKPYRMGKRNLPLNQLELILRRRAVIKRSDAQKEHAATNADRLGREEILVKEGGKSKINYPPSHSSSRKPPPHPHSHSPPRRKLFPSTTQQHSPTRVRLKADYHDDDSTISSTTVVSKLITLAPIQQSIEPTSPEQRPCVSSTASDTAIALSALPNEEIVGDTSLGLKLTIIHGKVIIQKITPLDDGRASSAQLCGLLSPGDIIIAVNGKSLINGTIHNPVSMDKIITVLKPLSQPMDAMTKEYSREVRLRFVLAEGKALLHEQEQREKQHAYERDLRKKLGLNGGFAGRGIDPVADLFGIGAFMGVDQHSGMPMFGHLERHHEEEKMNENNIDSVDRPVAANDEVVAVWSVPTGVDDATKATTTSVDNHPLQLIFAPARQTVQAQIAHQIHLDRQWIRHRNMSEFFSLSKNAPLLLRSPSPQIDYCMDLDADNSVDARKRRLERGAQVMSNATTLVSVAEAQDNGEGSFEDEDPMEVASRVCGTATVRTGVSRRRWHRGDSVIVEESSSHAASNDGDTIRSGESGVEACDHRLLLELAANNTSWKMNVLKRLDAFALETEKENIESLHGTHSDSNSIREEAGKTGFDSLLFGGDVANILRKQKQSMALPPGEITAMLFDLVELLESGLPNQIFTKAELPRSADPPFLPDKVVSFFKEENAEIIKATDFLLNQAFDKWLKSFRPLPWKQRRALWPTHQSGLDGDSMISSRMDDSDSLSLTSCNTSAQTRSPEMHKRNLRELIEQLELDPETRRET